MSRDIKRQNVNTIINENIHKICDKPCKQCNTNIRYIKTNRCVSCVKEHNKEHNKKKYPRRDNTLPQRGRIPNTTNVPSTRMLGKQFGTTYYFDGIACKHGHVANRYVRNAECSVCRKISTNKYNNSLPPGTLYVKYHKDYRSKRKENK